MANMSLEKVPMPSQDPEERIKNFNEVELGYTLEQATEEAERCLECKDKPCVDGCPVNIPIPEFLKKIKEKKIKEAYDIIIKENKFPAICGRVCPQETQCEELCVRAKKGAAVGIGRLERFVADYVMGQSDYEYPKALSTNSIKVAVIGSGPAGLTCAGELATRGYDVTIFEALHDVGGVLRYGIPEFRLPKKLLEKEIDNIIKVGVKIEKNVVVGRSITIDELLGEGYQALFIGSGAGSPSFLNIEGENLNGVYSASEFLTRANLMKAFEFPTSTTPLKIGNKVVVVGGGNVAMDAVRTAKRLGAEVTVVYRRSEKEMPARFEEVRHAKEEQIIFKFLTNPVKIIGENNGWVRKIECEEMELGEPDVSGRRKPIPRKGSSFIIEANTLIVAIGQRPNPLIRRATPGLEIKKSGVIVVDEETMQTKKEKVYAGGDVVTGAATVILAMENGKKAAKAIDQKLSVKK